MPQAGDTTRAASRNRAAASQAWDPSAPWMPLESGFGSRRPSPAQPCSQELFSRAVLVSEGSLPAPERSSRARSKSEAEHRSECRESFSKLKRSILLH